jgi:hypothetical protein
MCQCVALKYLFYVYKSMLVFFSRYRIPLYDPTTSLYGVITQKTANSTSIMIVAQYVSVFSVKSSNVYHSFHLSAAEFQLHSRKEHVDSFLYCLVRLLCHIEGTEFPPVLCFGTLKI